MKRAKWWKSLENSTVKCHLCPHNCTISEGEQGICQVRENQDGVLYSLTYNHPVTINVDPIEKKPLYHFLPGTKSLSIGTAGCNFSCDFCQNWRLVNSEPERYKEVKPEKVIQICKDKNCESIAFTYNEPTIYAEYALKISKLAKEENIKTLMVTNGFISEKAIDDLYPYIDAANIDLKAFTEEFYTEHCNGRMEPVLTAIEYIYDLDTFLEITNLVIPGLNDDKNEFKELLQWIIDKIGSGTPLHLSAFRPAYQLKNIPSTSKSTLDSFYELSKELGMENVYEGNVMSDEHNDTYCPACEELLIGRSQFTVTEKNLDQDKCKYCGEKINVRVD